MINQIVVPTANVNLFSSSVDASVHRVGVFSVTDVVHRLVAVDQPFGRDRLQQELSGGPDRQSSNQEHLDQVNCVQGSNLFSLSSYFQLTLVCR